MATEGTNKNNKANEEALNQTKANFSNDEMKSNSQITLESQKVNQDVVNPIKKVDDRLVFSLDVFNELSEEDYPSPIPKKDDELANANTVSNSIFDEIEKEEKIKHPSIINEIEKEKDKEKDKDGKGEFEYLNDEKDRILLEDIEKELQDKKHSEEIHNDKESISASTESTLSKDDKSDLSENNKSKEVGESVIDMVNTQTSANKKSSEKLNSTSTSNETVGDSEVHDLVSADVNNKINSKSKYRVKTDAKKPSEVISVISWFFLVLLTFIPGLNLMILVVLGFSKDIDEQVASWAKASLIIWSVITVLILYWYRHFIELFLL